MVDWYIWPVFVNKSNYFMKFLGLDNMRERGGGRESRELLHKTRLNDFLTANKWKCDDK